MSARSLFIAERSNTMMNAPMAHWSKPLYLLYYTLPCIACKVVMHFKSSSSGWSTREGTWSRLYMTQTEWYHTCNTGKWDPKTHKTNILLLISSTCHDGPGSGKASRVWPAVSSRRVQVLPGEIVWKPRIVSHWSQKIKYISMYCWKRYWHISPARLL